MPFFARKFDLGAFASAYPEFHEERYLAANADVAAAVRAGPDPAPPPAGTLTLTRASLVGNRPAWGVSATDVSTMQVPVTSRFH